MWGKWKCHFSFIVFGYKAKTRQQPTQWYITLKYSTILINVFFLLLMIWNCVNVGHVIKKMQYTVYTTFMFSCQPSSVLSWKHEKIAFSENNILQCNKSLCKYTASSLKALFQHHIIFMDWTFKELTGLCLKWMYTISGVLVCQEQTSPMPHRWKPSKLRYTIEDEHALNEIIAYSETKSG